MAAADEEFGKTLKGGFDVFVDDVLWVYFEPASTHALTARDISENEEAFYMGAVAALGILKVAALQRGEDKSKQEELWLELGKWMDQHKRMVDSGLEWSQRHELLLLRAIRSQQLRADNGSPT